MRGKSFLFFLAATAVAGPLFIFGATNAHAYAVSSTGAPLGGQPQPSTSSGVNANYNFDGSFQNLVSPFKDFFNSLQWNNSATVNIVPASTAMPPINISSSLQNTLSQPFVAFDNWFYGLTGVRLSGIVVVILNIISWALSAILGAVNWLLLKVIGRMSGSG